MKRVIPRLLLSLALLALTASLAWSAAPVIEAVSIDTGMDMDAPGWQSYHERVVVTVSDTDGFDDIGCLEITAPGDPEDRLFTVPICHGLDPGIVWWQVDDFTVGVEWQAVSMPDEPAVGRYIITAYANDNGSWLSDTITTDDLPLVSGTCGTVVSPVIDSVIPDAAPTFEWTNGSPADFVRLEVEREADPDPVWSVDLPATATSAAYNFDETSAESTLLPNYAYFWTVGAWVQHPDPEPRVSLFTAN